MVNGPFSVIIVHSPLTITFTNATKESWSLEWPIHQFQCLLMPETTRLPKDLRLLLNPMRLATCESILAAR
jgi:hypothetical protein